MHRLAPRSLPRRLPGVRWVVAASAGLGLWLGAGAARAQSITLPAVPERTISNRPTGQNPLWINHDDCVADDAFVFDLGVSSVSGYSLEIWAGTVDCTPTDARQGAAPQCWEVHPRLSITDASPRVLVRSQDIVAQHRGSYVAADATVCENASASEPAQVTLYFMLVDASGQLLLTAAPKLYTAIKYDLVGPPAPTNLRAGAGENRLVIEFDAPSTTDRSGYRFYCDDGTAPPPPPDPATAGDGGVEAGAPDAGAEAGSPEGGTEGGSPEGGGEGGVPAGSCETVGLVPGDPPQASLLCGSVGIGGEGEAHGLSNGVRYAVGVASVDTAGNVGPLSELVCGTPEQVSDFFELYRAAGGQGGGGYCAVGWRDARPGLPGAALALAGALLLSRRRGSPR